MLKVLIVDDELVIRKGLKKVINWEEYGFHICGEAAGGREGLEKVEALNPDLIIVDIKMPKIDGLEMIRRLRGMGNKSRVFLLTGYSEFKYAQEAITLGVDAYILKPIEEEELVDKLKTVRQKIEEDRKSSMVDDAVNLASDKVMQSLIFGEIDDTSTHKYNQLYSLGLPWNSYQVILIDMDRKRHEDKNSVADVRRVLEKFVEGKGYGRVFELSNFISILIKDFVFTYDNLNVIRTMCRQVLKECDIQITVSIGQSVDNLGDIFHSYDSAIQLLKKRFIYSTENIICFDKEDVDDEDEDTFYPPNIEETAQKLYMALDMAQTEYVNNLLEDFRLAVISGGMDEKEIKTLYINLYTSLFNAMVKNYEDVVKAVVQEENVAGEIYGKPDLQKLHGYFKYLVYTMAEEIRNRRPDHVMKRILSYIDRNYDRDIKLASISEVFGYNSIYLGRRFKEYTGISFNTYLDRVRIENAKELLKRGNKVYDVAQQVGYGDKDYFYSKFKKYVGIPPSQYKKSIME